MVEVGVHMTLVGSMAVLRSFIDFAWHDSDKLIKINENFVYLCMLCKLTVILLSLFTIHCMP